MTQPAAYSGTVEALTWEEAAVRCRLTVEAFKRHYTGRVCKIGSSPRIAVHHLMEWLDRQAEGDTVAANEWDEVGDATQTGVQGRQAGEAA